MRLSEHEQQVLAGVEYDLTHYDPELARLFKEFTAAATPAQRPPKARRQRIARWLRRHRG